MISERQKKIRRWFQRHGWHTNSTPTGHGAWLFMPRNGCDAYSTHIEINRFGEEHVDISIENMETGHYEYRVRFSFDELRKIVELIEETDKQYTEFCKSHKIPKKIAEEELLFDY